MRWEVRRAPRVLVGRVAEGDPRLDVVGQDKDARKWVLSRFYLTTFSGSSPVGDSRRLHHDYDENGGLLIPSSKKEEAL